MFCANSMTENTVEELAMYSHNETDEPVSVLLVARKQHWHTCSHMHPDLSVHY